MKNPKLLITCAVCLLMAGCSSLKKNKNEVVLDEEAVAKALARAKHPQQFGFKVYPTSNNSIAMSGRARLHPMQTATADFIRDGSPVIRIEGASRRMNLNALIDPASAETWFEYSNAMDFRAAFLGLDGRVISYRGGAFTGGVEGYAAVVPQIRIKQLFIEDAPVYVRMAINSLGPLNRGIQDCQIGGVIGYNTLSSFEYIRFDLNKGRIMFSATRAYTPDESRLIGTARIVPAAGGALAVQGRVNGRPTPILIDPAGNFGFALNNATLQTTDMVELGEIVYVNEPTVGIASPDGLPRAGATMLRKYIVTVCPLTGTVYFERAGP